MAKIKLAVAVELDSVSFTLADGREVQVLPDGHVYVQAGRVGEYSFTIPTAEDIAHGCDETDDNQIPFYASHRH